MTNIEAMRRQVLGDQLEGAQELAERWQRDAWDSEELDEAVRWFEISGMVRTLVKLLRS